MLEILDKITEGNGTMEDIDNLERLAKNIKAASLCGLGQTAPNPVLSTLQYFREEYEAHVLEHRCPAGACKALSNYYILETCKGCGICMKACPVEAISGERKQVHVIDLDVCIKCGECMAKCPFDAIVRR